MKNEPLLSVLVGAAAGAVAGAVAVVVLGRGAEDPAGGASPPGVIEAPLAAPGGDDGARQAELGALRAELAMLRERVKGLETRPVPAPRQAVAAPADDALDAEALDELRRLVAALEDPNAAVPASLSDSVRQAYEDIREEERDEREQARAEMREQELDRRMERYTEALGLDAWQQDEMRVVLTTERERRDALFASAREDGAWMDLREGMRELRDETGGALATLLTPEQLERYESMDRGFGGGPGGPRGPGSDDGGRRRGR